MASVGGTSIGPQVFINNPGARVRHEQLGYKATSIKMLEHVWSPDA